MLVCFSGSGLSFGDGKCQLRRLPLELYRRDRLGSRKEKKGTYIRNVKQFKAGFNIGKHAWTQDHTINFDECKILDEANYRQRTTLESWHTATTLNSDNNAQNLPEQYTFLLKGNRS